MKISTRLYSKGIISFVRRLGKLPAMRPVRVRFPVFATIAFVVLLCLPVLALAGDPNGSGTGTAKDVAAATNGQPTVEELANEVGIRAFR